MRVGMYYNNRDVRVEEKPVPDIGPGEILLKIHASGICGSDLMEWYRIGRSPLVLGHEVAGEVAKVGSEVRDFAPGDRVTATHHVPCGTCHTCRRGHQTTCETLRRTNFDPGGFSEYVRVPEINVRSGVLKLPGNVSYEAGSFAEPLGCAVRGLRLAGLRRGDSVVVIGTGASGLLYVHLAAAMGAGRIFGIDTVPNRIEAARKLGASVAGTPDALGPDAVRPLNEGRLADLVVVCAGASRAIEGSVRLVEPGGTVLFSAPMTGNAHLDIPFNDLFWRNEITLTSTYGSAPSDLAEAVRLISEKRVDVTPIITHRIGLSEIGEGFRLAGAPHECLKVMVDPSR